MNNFTFDVSFRISHPNMNVQYICEKLDMQATHKWNVSEQRRTPKGTLLPGFYESSYCTFKLEHPKNKSLIKFLTYWNNILYKHIELLTQIHSSGGKIEYFIGWYSKGNSGEVFDIGLMAKLVELKINLSIDFYC